jgi:hypothetical protein
MKALILAGILAFSGSAFAFEIHSVSRFTIDWNDRDSLTQVDGLGCPGESNTVVLTVPGRAGRDFTVAGPGGDCRLVSSHMSGRASGRATTLVYRGDCASDNDENFTVTRKADPSQQAHITVDSGC